MSPVYPRIQPEAFICPCGARTSDPVSICDGICRVCGEPTGLCQAGRTVLSPEGARVPGWETPCPALGTAWWHLHLPGGRGPGWKAIHPLLCTTHDREALYLPWIHGIPIKLREEEEVKVGLSIARAALKRAGVVAAVALTACGLVLLGAFPALAGTLTYYHG